MAGYGAGLAVEALAEGENSKVLKFATTGTFDADWMPFFLDAEMAKLYDLQQRISIQGISLPGFLQMGELHSEDPAPIETANISFNIGVVKTVINDKTVLQNVVDVCYFHAEESFGPMCVICKLLDKDGNVIGAGMVKDDNKDYIASETIPIPITPLTPHDNEDDEDDHDGKDDDHDGKDEDKDDYRKYFDNKDFSTHFSKYDFQKFFKSNEFKKYYDKYKNYNHDDDDHDDEDSECDCEKPDVFTVLYDGPSGVTVEIYKNTNDIGDASKRLYTFPFSIDNGALIPLDSNLNLGQDTVNANTVYNFIKNGASIGVVSIHTSCSQPLFVGQTFFYHQGQADEIKLTVDSATRDGSPSIPPDTCEDGGDNNGGLSTDVQDVEGVKVIICKPPSKCVPTFADFKTLKHGTKKTAINAALASSGISISADGNNGIDEVIIFDADKTGTPDPDLQVKNGLHLLIMPETGTFQDSNNDGYIDNPNDSAKGGTIFVRMQVPVFLKSFVLVDHENDPTATAKAYDAEFGGNLIKSVTLPITGDGKFTTVNMNAANVKRLEVTYKDSGGITNIDIRCEPPKGEGCTPGFWKQDQHFKFWKIYKKTDKFGTVFGISTNVKIKVDNKDIWLKDATLLQALKAQGGGVNALARHAVAGLLNAASGANYAFTVDEVKLMVKTAIQSGNSNTIESTKNKLEEANEKGCPFGDDKCDCEDHKEKYNKYYDDHKKYYDNNKKQFKKDDYKKYMDEHKNFLDYNGKYMDKYDYKTHTDYFKKFLDDNKKYFDSNDYKKYSDDHKKYSDDYKNHGDKCKCEDDKGGW
jgi:hypothetical protein